MSREASPSVGILWLCLFIPQSTSLKERRHVVRSLLDQTRRQNVSVSDLGPVGSRKEAHILFAIAGSSPESASRFLDSLERQICRLEENALFEIREIRREVEIYGDF
ncbi:MAG: DUF503 domain-containing protein [Synergistaceae bacterium]|jgi:uncharacterized protein YlxP (DUF503 family)|nr:DUF503 domain-containing protein [Synergistaceae bacterium]